MSVLRVAGTIPESIVDGPGIRYVLFTQGCPHRCPGCHNPQTHDFSGGREMTVEALLADITARPYVKAVTFSGGEPFAQASAFARLGRLLKAQGYELASYSGYTFEELFLGTPEQRELLETIDVLIDGPFLQAQKSLELAFRGSRNQRILDVPGSLEAGKAVEITTGRWQGEY